MRFSRIASLVLLVFCFLTGMAAAMPERPTTDIYVQDNAGLLSSATKEKLLAIGHELDKKTTAQIAVVTVENLDDRPIAEYANDLFRKWGIGSKDKNNGVLLLISKDPRKVRIEVGYGLEGALPDGYTGRVQDEELVPNLKKDDYDAGVLAAYTKLAGKTAEEYQQQLDSLSEQPATETAESAETAEDTEEDSFWADVVVWAIVIIVILLVGFFLLVLIGWLWGDDSDSSTTGGAAGSTTRSSRDSDSSSWSSSSDDGDSFGGGDSGGGGSDDDY